MRRWRNHYLPAPVWNSFPAPDGLQEHLDLRTSSARVFSVSGTPVDSVIVGMHQVGACMP
jgi:hypothetical protein